MAFDGSDFKGLDGDVVASNDGDDEVLDTWLEHRLRGNEYYLLQGRESISWQPYAGSSSLTDYQSGDRPYASLEWSTILCVPWVYEPTLSSIIFDLYYRIASSGVDTENYYVKYELRDAEYKVLASKTELLSNTAGSTPTWQTHGVEVELDRKVQKRQTGWLIIWGQSILDSDYTGSDVDLIGHYHQWKEFNTTPIFGAGSGSPPNNTYAGEMVLVGQFDETNGTGSPLVIDIFQDQNFSAPGLPTPIATGFHNFRADYRQKWLTYIQVRSITIEGVHDLAQAGYPSEQIRANIPVRGEAATAHARLAREAESRPRCIWLGPTPTFGDSELIDGQWASYEWAQRWRYVIAENADGTPVNFSDASVRLATDDPTVDVWLWLIGVHIRPRYKPFGMEPSTYEALIDEAASASWEITATLSQLTDGDASWASATEIGSTSITTRITHYRDDPSGVWPFLYQQFLLAGGDSSEYDFVFREGQLFESDISLLRPVRISVPLSGLDSLAKLTQFCRLSLTAEYLGGAIFPVVDDPNSPANTTDNLRLVCVGASAWQRKELSR